MEHNWTPLYSYERARERMATFEKEIKQQRLLKEAACEQTQFVFFCTAMRLTGNLLIAIGTWLNQQATPNTRSSRSTRAGRFSSIPQ